MNITLIGIVGYTFLLITALVYDLRKMIIPNWLTYPGIILALLFCFLTGVETSDIILRMILTGGLFLGTSLLTSVILKKETMGGGDIKLITMIGLYKGWQEGLLIIFFSAVSALISVIIISVLKKGKQDDRIPFGFYIGICALFYEGLELLNLIQFQSD